MIKNRSPEDALIRTEGEGYPAAWVGGGARNGKVRGTVLCKGKRSDGHGEKRWDLSLREPMYVKETKSPTQKMALVGVAPDDLVFQVEGELPLDRKNRDIDVFGIRIEDRWEATSRDDNGTERLSNGKARGLFFRLLNRHPKLRSAFQRDGGEAHTGTDFVAEEDQKISIPAFTLHEAEPRPDESMERDGCRPAVWVGGGTLKSGKLKAVIHCTETLTLRKPIRIRETSHLSLRRVLLPVHAGDFVFWVEGQPPFDKENFSLNVESYRVKRISPEEDLETEEVPRGEARRILLRLLKKHAKLRRSLHQRNGIDGRAFTKASQRDSEAG